MKTLYMYMTASAAIFTTSVAFAAPRPAELTALLSTAHAAAAKASPIATRLQTLRDHTIASPPPLDRRIGVARQMEKLGPEGFLPLVALFDDAGVKRAPAGTQRAIKMSALEALRRLRDPRGAALYRDVLDNDSDDDVARSAAEALGALETQTDMQFLLDRAMAGHPRERAAWSGLAFCRRGEVAGHLAARMTELPDATTMKTLAMASSFWGSSWAWQALGAQREADGLGARQQLASTLLSMVPSYTDSTRQAIVNAIVAIEHPATKFELDRVRNNAAPDVVKDLDLLATRLK